VTRGQLPKAFLRVDPDIDQKHPDNLDGFIRLLCAANRQVPRGRFSSRAVMDRLFGKAAVDKFAKRKDIRTEPDGSITVVGWHVWQEGDWTVAERMRRYRESKGGISGEETSLDPSPTVTTGVTDTVTEIVTVASPASEASRRQGVKASRRQGVKASRRQGALASEPRARNGGDPGEDVDGYDAVVTWLASRKAWADSPKLQTDLARLVDRRGADAVIAAMSAVPGAEDAAQFVYGARNALFPLPGATVAQESREDREARQRTERRRSLGLEAAQ
jgi:hypothetical protein